MQRESVYDKMTRSEKEVAELLKSLGIKWSYERPVFVWDENKRPRSILFSFFFYSGNTILNICVGELLIGLEKDL